MRPVNKDETPKDSNGQEIKFKEYQRARRYLIDTISEYCSYCERKIVTNLAVEHIEPKSILKNKHLELKWSNFLLGCTNCNSTKSDKNIVLSDYFWADSDTDNTYSIFSYDDSGVVKVSSQITELHKIQKATNTIKLVGLNKKPPKKNTRDWEEASDRRFEQRIQAFKDAQEQAKNYSIASFKTRDFMLPLIKIAVLGGGFWSIWMRAFDNFPEVQKELINAFAGTRKEFFSEVLNS